MIWHTPSLQSDGGESYRNIGAESFGKDSLFLIINLKFNWDESQ